MRFDRMETAGTRQEAEERRYGLAVRAVEACRNQLFFRYRFLEQALFRLKWQEWEGFSFGSDGESFYFNKEYILKRYMEDAGQLSLDYLHTVLHCLYQHPFFCVEEHKNDWNLAADLAVECVLEELAWEEESAEPFPGTGSGTAYSAETLFWGESTEEETAGSAEAAAWTAAMDGEETEAVKAGRRKEVTAWLKGEIGVMSARKIFLYLQENFAGQGKNRKEEIFAGLCRLFKRDEHSLWYREKGMGEPERCRETWGSRENGKKAPRLQGEDGREREQDTGEKEPKDGESSLKAGKEQNHGWDVGEREPAGRGAFRRNLQRQWKEAAEQILMAGQTFLRQEPGLISGNLLQNLRKLAREEQDYSAFLKKFARHPIERMQIDQEEFDAAFYTYGLRVLGKVPLLEPLEYREKRLIREFVIAIDTSASCQGELVERFLRKTCSILQQEQAFAAKLNIHIIQCDACIQEDAKIEFRQDLDRYLGNFTLRGFGGTDFTPVFAYVDELLETGGLSGLDGLLYFTDGYGRFPAKSPGYRTAFVFLDRAEDVKVPPWAMKVYLDEEVLK